MDPDDVGRHDPAPDSAPDSAPESPADPVPAAAPHPAAEPAPDPAPPTAGRDRFGLVIPMFLAALGLAAALIAWRGGVAANAAQDASRAGLDAARERSASVIINEGLTARSLEGFLDYERSRRRAEALDAAGLTDQALLERKQATSHWFLVQPEYLDAQGQLQPDRQRAALLADDATQADLDPGPHFAVADAEYARIRDLILAGVVVALALPFLTVAEISRGRVRLLGVFTGAGFFGIGLVLAAIAWL